MNINDQIKVLELKNQALHNEIKAIELKSQLLSKPKEITETKKPQKSDPLLEKAKKINSKIEKIKQPKYKNRRAGEMSRSEIHDVLRLQKGSYRLAQDVIDHLQLTERGSGIMKFFVVTASELIKGMQDIKRSLNKAFPIFGDRSLLEGCHTRAEICGWFGVKDSSTNLAKITGVKLNEIPTFEDNTLELRRGDYYYRVDRKELELNYTQSKKGKHIKSRGNENLICRDQIAKGLGVGNGSLAADYVLHVLVTDDDQINQEYWGTGSLFAIYYEISWDEVNACYLDYLNSKISDMVDSSYEWQALQGISTTAEAGLGDRARFPDLRGFRLKNINQLSANLGTHIALFDSNSGKEIEVNVNDIHPKNINDLEEVCNHIEMYREKNMNQQSQLNFI